jgi:hypothetical protein
VNKHLLWGIILVACSTKTQGVDSESHFLCKRDADCRTHAEGARCVEGTCVEPSSTDASSGTPAPSHPDAGSPSPDGPHEAPETLVSGAPSPAYIAVDDQRVYWMNLGRSRRTGPKDTVPNGDGQVLSCPLTGCDASPTIVATGLDIMPEQTGFAVASGKVFFAVADSNTGGRNIEQCEGARCDVLTASGVTSLLADGSDLYWGALGNSVSACTTAACAPRTLARPESNAMTGSASLNLVADTTTVYWIWDTLILSCAKTGCNGMPRQVVPSSPVWTTSQPLGLAVDDTYVYWTAWDLQTAAGLLVAELLRCEKSGCQTPSVLMTGHHSFTTFVRDGNDLYWWEAGSSNDGGTSSDPTDGRIEKCPVTGCDTPATLVSHVEAPFALDGTSIYYVVGDGSGTAGIHRIAK